MEQLNKPKPFTPSKSNVNKDWQRWKEEFLIYIRLSGAYVDCTEEQRALILLNLMGIESIKALEQISFDHPNEKNDMDILLMKFDEIFDPSINEVEQRYKFFSRIKNKNESIEHYVMDLKEIALKCNFGQQSDKFIIDKIILNMDHYLRNLIFLKQDVSLSDVIQNYKQHEKYQELSESMLKTESKKNCTRCETYHPYKKCPAEIKPMQICSKCGTNHPYKQCPAFDSTCQNCFAKGHYSNRCKQTEIKKSQLPNNTSDNHNKKPSPQPFVEKTPVNLTPKIDCNWCGVKHDKGKCQHDTNCTNCNSFPHKICFQCKRNPHDINCYFKNIVTLPLNDKKNIPNEKSDKPPPYDCFQPESKFHTPNVTPKSTFKNNIKVENTSQPSEPNFFQSKPSREYSGYSKPKTKKNNDTCNIS